MSKTRTIEIKVEVKAEGWDVNWDDPIAAHEELFKLKGELRGVMSRNMGIDHQGITVEAKLADE